MTPLDAPMGALFTIVPIIVVLGFVFVIGSMIYRFYAAKREGFDPLAGDIQLAAKARDSKLLAEDRSVEERLAEVDELLAQGTISAEEHKAARARIIGSL